MKEVIKILESHPLFRAVSRKALEDLTGKAKLCRYPKGDTIYASGSFSEFLYLVLEGLCVATPEDLDQEPVTYGMGALFGEYGAINNKRRQNTISSIAETLLLQIPSNNLRNFISENEKLTNLFEGKKHNQLLYFDTQEKSFKPCQKNLISFADFTPAGKFNDYLPRLCQSLYKETGKPVLLLEFATDRGDIDLPDLGDRINLFNTRNKSDSHDSDLPYLNIKVKLGNDERAYPYLRPFLEYSSREFPYIIAYLPGGHSSQTMDACIAQSNTIYLSLDINHSDSYAVRNFVQTTANEEAPTPKPILLCGSECPIEPLINIQKQIGIPLHTIFRDSPEAINIPEYPDKNFERNKRFNGQFRRLAREIGHCRIGLALSSGGAKGLAHVGVIQVLEENDIEIDYIAGTSIGSYVAACWARGYNGKVMEELAQQYNRQTGIFDLIDPLLPPRRGVIRGDKVLRRLQEILSNARFEDLSMPLGVVATNLKKLDREILSSGDVASAVVASCTLPGICRPRERKGEVYVDGGITDPLPIDVLESWGIENIIAVSTVPSTNDYRESIASKKHAPEQNRSLRSRALSFLNTHLNYFAKGNVFDTVMRSIEAGQIRMVERDLFRTDVVIRAVACEAQWHDFTHPQQHIERGRKAALEQLELLKSLVTRKES